MCYRYISQPLLSLIGNFEKHARSEVVKIISNELQPITNNRIANQDRALREDRRGLLIGWGSFFSLVWQSKRSTASERRSSMGDEVTKGEHVFGTGSRAGAYLPNKSGWGIPRHWIIKPILWIAGVSTVSLENAMGILRLWETPSDVILICRTLHS